MTNTGAAAQTNNGEKLMRVMAFTLVFSVMNGTMFNVVLPVIGKEFGLVPSQLSWMMTGYMIVYAVGSVTYGKLADKYRLKDLLVLGLVIFALGSIVGLMATQYWMIILGRVLQASGASVIPATSVIIPVRYFTPERRGRALGTTATGLALGAALGPIVAGLVTGLASWRFLFLLSLIPLLALPFFRKYLDDETGKTTSIDFLGGALLAGTVALFLLGVTQGSPWLFVANSGLLALFAIRVRKAREPFVNLRLLRNKSYSLGLFFTFMATSMNFGMPFITPQFLTRINGLPPLSIGFVMFPAAVVAAMMGRKIGRLADSRGNLFLVLTAGTLLFLCFILLSTFVGSSPYLILFLLILGSLGQAFMQIAMSNTVSRSLSKEQAGVGMGLYAMLHFISGATATSLIGKLLDSPSPAVLLNPLAVSPQGHIYSNIFTVLAFMAIMVAGMYYTQFKPADRLSRRSSMKTGKAAYSKPE